MEMANPTAHIFGDQKWYLSLRNYGKYNEKIYYKLPVGNACNGLWMYMTEDPNKVMPIIRSPKLNYGIDMMFSRNDFEKAKIKKDYRRISQIIPIVGLNNISQLTVSYFYNLGERERFIPGRTKGI